MTQSTSELSADFRARPNTVCIRAANVVVFYSNSTRRFLEGDNAVRLRSGRADPQVPN